MTRRDLSLTIALCASLMAHAALALITFEGARRQLATIRLPGYPRSAADTIEADPTDAIRLGGLRNEGLSPNATPGEESSRAKEAPGDQALLSRDPVGPGRIGDPPSFSMIPPTDGPTVDATPAPAGARSTPVLAQATESPQPFGAGPSAADIVVPKHRPAPPSPAVPESAAAKSNKPAADPAIMSPSESDAFSTLGGIEFRDGRMDARLGRAFKSVRPQLSFAAQVELFALANPRMILRLSIDATGKVTAVDVVSSSGSDLVDQPVKIALYQWWFEPAKGPNGKPIAETVTFPVSWH
jgi:TonB family protein